MTDCSFRFSRYDPSLRHADGTYPDGTWTELFDVIDELGAEAGLAEYERVEDTYVEAVRSLLRQHGAEEARLADVERNGLVTGLLEQAGAALTLPDPLAELVSTSVVLLVVRAGLRGQLWCRIQAADLEITFGHDLYMHVRTSRSCDAAKAVVAEQGLFVQDAEYPVE